MTYPTQIPRSQPAAAPTGAMALFEDAVARLTATVTEHAEDGPFAVAQQEDAADRVVDLLAARAWHALPHSSHGDSLDVARRCLAHAVAADLRAATPQHRRDPGETHRLACHALLLLTLPEHFDAATDRARALLGEAPEGRLLAAWRMTDEALATLGTTRHEWVGADPDVVAAAGWVLVDRVGRVLESAALVHQAVRAAEPASVLLVNAARRFAWNRLRGAAPEAASPTHVRRSAELVAALASNTQGCAG
jgi:hypothetical protein